MGSVGTYYHFESLHRNIFSPLIHNFLGYSYKRLVTVKKIIKSFFKKRSFKTQSNVEIHFSQAYASHPESSTRIESPQMECHQTKTRRVKSKDVDLSSIVRDPGLRQSIWDYYVQQRDEIRRAYIKVGPYQPTSPNSPDYIDKNGRRCLNSWYKLFLDWLEYSPTKNATFCLPCFLFNKPHGRHGSSTFTVDGFRS